MNPDHLDMVAMNIEHSENQHVESHNHDRRASRNKF